MREFVWEYAWSSADEPDDRPSWVHVRDGYWRRKARGAKSMNITSPHSYRSRRLTGNTKPASEAKATLGRSDGHHARRRKAGVPATFSCLR